MYCWTSSVATRLSNDLFRSTPNSITSWKNGPGGTGAVDDWVAGGAVDDVAVGYIMFDPVPEYVPDGTTPEGTALPEGKMPDEVTVPDGDETPVWDSVG